MRISVKLVTVVSVILGCAGFVYVLGFAPIDARKSPRAWALDAQPSMERLIVNVRQSMESGQKRGALGAGDELGERFGDEPEALLNRGYAYREVGFGEDGIVELSEIALGCWTRLVEVMRWKEIEHMEGFALSEALYLRGWGLRGMGRIEESRADFVAVARIVEGRLGMGEGGEGGEGGVPLYIQDPQVARPTSGAPGMAPGGGSGMASGGVGEGVNPAVAYNLACYWAVGGDFDRALEYWKRCVEGGYLEGGIGGWWKVDPDFEELRLDDRFWEIVEGGKSEEKEGRED